jgi:hypothetical protein
MHTGLGMRHELMQGFIELGRRLQHRVPQGKIVDVVSAILLLELDALLEHGTYPGGSLHVLTHALSYGHREYFLSTGAVQRRYVGDDTGNPGPHYSIAERMPKHA